MATICLYICWRDYKCRIISNASVFFLGALLTSSCFVHGSQIQILNTLVLLIPGLFLWKIGAFGAGDIKLICTFSLLIKPDLLFLTVVIVMLLGGVEALLYTLIKSINPASIVHDGLPFAIPIVCSGVFSIVASI
ncbi:prepilin peptidase [Vibrio variabilis]|uniref:prepilin peptidase n=1 Tax=Vibrio variabilis TaxID=990271 RepID=UPI0018CEEA27